MKNPNAPAVKREAEEDWHKSALAMRLPTVITTTADRPTGYAAMRDAAMAAFAKS